MHDGKTRISNSIPNYFARCREMATNDEMRGQQLAERHSLALINILYAAN